MHAIEKILCRAAGRDQVSAGEIVECEVDIAGINDLYYQTVLSFEEMGGMQVANPENVVVFFDHYAPPSTDKQALNQKKFREFCQKQGIPNLQDVNTGVCHQVLAESGFSRPGRLIVVTDSHTTLHGALGAFGTGVGATDLAIILKTGKLWFRVPEVIRINIDGNPPQSVYAKDVILHIIGQLKADYAIYCAIEFTGSYIQKLSISERMVLCNMTTEMGAKAAYIQPDAVTVDYLQKLGVVDYIVYESDSNYRYKDELYFNVSDLHPQLASPDSVDNVSSVKQYEGIKIDQAFLGTCTGGRLEDIAVAADILKDKQIAPGARLLVVPASRKVLLEAIEQGYMEILLEAGATFVTPGCAACLGTHEGIIAAGETAISSSNRNFPGRMGSVEGKIYLASPATVAASALKGSIVALD